MKNTIVTKATAFGAALCAVFLTAATPAAAAAAAVANDFVGLWNNPGRNAGGITQMVVTRERLGVTLEVFGDCQPRDCNWGSARGTVYSLYGDRGGPDGAIIASFTAGFSEKLIILREARGNQLTVDVFTNFTDRSGRPNTMTSLRLVRGRPGPGGGRVAGFRTSAKSHPISIRVQIRARAILAPEIPDKAIPTSGGGSNMARTTPIGTIPSISSAGRRRTQLVSSPAR